MQLILDGSKTSLAGIDLLSVVLVDQNNHLTRFPIYTWYDIVKTREAAGEKPEVETTAKYPLVDITGKAILRDYNGLNFLFLYAELKNGLGDKLFTRTEHGAWEITLVR